MSNFARYTGYIYPLPQMTDGERFEYLGKVNEGLESIAIQLKSQNRGTMTDKELKTMKAFILQKDEKYFLGGKYFEWTYDLQDAHRFLKRETAQAAIQKYGCLEHAIIIDCIIKYRDNDTYIVIEKDDRKE